MACMPLLGVLIGCQDALSLCWRCATFVGVNTNVLVAVVLYRVRLELLTILKSAAGWRVVFS